MEENFSINHDRFKEHLRSEFAELELCIQESLKVLSKQQESRDESSHLIQSLVRHSLFISVYAFFEYSLKRLCVMVAIERQQSRRRVYNFEKVHQYYSYLIDEINLDRAKTEEDWQKLNIYRDIRNSIIHHNSNIGKNISTQTYSFIIEDERIEYVENSGFKIKNDELIKEMIKVSERFLFTLMEEIDSK